MLDRPNEPSPEYELGVHGGRDSEGRTCTLVPVPLYAKTSEFPKMQFENVVTSSLYSLADRCPSVSVELNPF